MKIICILITFFVFSTFNIFAEGEFQNFKKKTNLKQDEKLITVFYSRTTCVNCFVEIFDALRYLKKDKNFDKRKNKLLFVVFEERKKLYEKTVDMLNFDADYIQGSQLMQRNLGINIEEFLVVFGSDGKIIYRYKYKGNLYEDLVKILK